LDGRAFWRIDMDLLSLSQFFFSGLSTGCIYALVALGYVLCFNATRVINFAQGEYVMVGGLAAASAAAMGVSLWLSVILAIVAGGMVGFIQERVTLAPVRDAPDYIRITLTLGFAVVARGLALIVWGKDPYPLQGFTSEDVFLLLGAVLPIQTLWIWGLTLAILVGTFLFLGWTRWGRAVRACSDNTVAARLMGINPDRVSLLVFVIGGSIGALGGAVITPVTLASYGMGLDIGVKGFIGALIGGYRHPGRAAAGGLALGVLETMAAGYVSSGARDIVVYGLLVIFLVVSSGLLQRGRRSLQMAGRP
jgi:branched-subunit amino acid ABC-type transport system permease component